MNAPYGLARRYYCTGAGEIVHDPVKRLAVRRMRRYPRELELADVRNGQCGVRAQALLDDGMLVDDFRLEEDRETLSVVNAPSRAATASLAIGKLLAQRAMERA